MSTKYTHQELGKDVIAGIGGYYTPLKEVRLKHNGREVLYVVGHAVIESSCCGVGNWGYAIVPGYIVNWQNDRNEDGLPVSEVESVSDGKEQAVIRKTIEAEEDVSMAGFW